MTLYHSQILRHVMKRNKSLTLLSFTVLIGKHKAQHRGLARGFIMLKPTKNGELRDICRITKALIRLRRCAGWSAPLMFASNKVRVSPIEACMMLKPRLPGLRLATRLQQMTKSYHNYEKNQSAIKILENFLADKCVAFTNKCF